MDLNAAAIFAQVVDAGGFSAAARKLGMPKTTVSKRVGDLEATLGVRLLNRTTRRISLTEAGARLHAHCREALRHIDLAEREIHGLQSEPHGLLRIGAPSAIGVRFLLPVITAIMAEHPGLRVSLLAVNDDVQTVGDGLDVLVWPGPLVEKAHVIRLVARIEIGLYASAAYLAAFGEPTTPAALESHRVVAFTQALSAGRFSWTLTRGRTTVTVVPETPPQLLSNDAAVIMAAACAGQGIAALPTEYVAHSPEAVGLVNLLPDWRTARIELNAFSRDGSSGSAKNRMFLDHIGHWFRESANTPV